MRRTGNDEGSVLPLAIFFGMLALVVVLLAIAATSLYLERTRLYALADGAALVGAESFELSDIRVAGEGDEVAVNLDDRAVRAAVDDYLGEVDTSRFEGLRVVRAESGDGRSATVELSSFWRPPVVTSLVPEGVPIAVTSVARSVFS